MSVALVTDVIKWKLSNLYGIDLPPVSSIPGLKATRTKGYDGYYAYVFLSTAGEVDFKRIANIHQLPTSSDQDWLETIQSEFSANPASKLKFEIYGRRRIGSDKAIGAIVTTIKDISERCGEDGVINLDFPIRDDGKAPKLCLRIHRRQSSSRLIINRS